MNVIYTIGYAGFEQNDFIKELQKYNVTCLIDVRSKPYSGYYKDYNIDILKEVLNKNNILYRNYSYGFGAWQQNPEFFSVLSTGERYLDFDKFRCSPQFQEDFSKIKQGNKLGYTFALMCSEIDPIRCHRNIMVAKAFFDDGFEVLNIVPKSRGYILSQYDIEEQLLKKYKAKTDISIGNEVDLYKYANIDIAYKLKDNN